MRIFKNTSTSSTDKRTETLLERLASEVMALFGSLPFVGLAFAGIGALHTHSPLPISAEELYIAAMVGRGGWGLARRVLRFLYPERQIEIVRWPLVLMLYSWSIPIYWGVAALLARTEARSEAWAVPLLVVGGRLAEASYAQAKRWGRVGRAVQATLVMSSAALFGLYLSKHLA
jgi:hypothetical protein